MGGVFTFERIKFNRSIYSAFKTAVLTHQASRNLHFDKYSVKVHFIKNGFYT